MLKTILALVFVALGCLAVQPAYAASICRLKPASDALLLLPIMLVPNVEKAFDLHDMEPAEVQHLTVARCVSGHVYACFVGANLPCGKADLATSRPDITAWCEKNPNADFIPAYVTGHDTAYNWRCIKGQAGIESPSVALDASGFLKDYWRRVD